MKKHMKLLFSASLFLIHSLSIFSQETDWSRMHALKGDKGEINIEISGYQISIIDMGHTTKDDASNSLKKRFKLDNIVGEYTDPELGIENKIIESQAELESKNKIAVNQICYLLMHPKGKPTAVFMQTINQRDIVLETDFVKTYIKGELTNHISTDTNAASILFAGREIEMDSTCQWKKPHNIICKEAQISWSEFSSFESAMLDINNCILANNKKDTDIVKEEDIDILFDGMPAVAHRVVHKDKRLSILIVYYIVQEVRGQYISCIMSNYGYNEYDYSLAPLLQKLMGIPNPPQLSYFDLTEASETSIFGSENRRSDDDDDDNGAYPLAWEVRAGTWLPIGSLNNSFKVAPSIGVFLGFPINQKLMCDLGFQFAFPVNRNYFDYFYYRDVYDAKSNIIVNASIRLRYEQRVAQNVYFANYLGIGISSLQTNLEKEDSDSDYPEWYSVETINLFGGVSLRYKKVGCFIEYHYTPYSIAGKVSESFGNSAVNLGMLVCF